MRDRRVLGAALIGATLASAAVPPGGADAQLPMPPPPPASAPMAGPAVPIRPGLPPAIPAGGPVHVHQPGPIARAAHHVGFTIKDRMIGEHERFHEPPLGWSVGQNFGAHSAMAEQHRFTLYRSDFFAGTDHLTPDGLRRLGRMVARWDCWAGPLLVELDPIRPGLAEARRIAVLELAANNGAALDPSRLVVGGSPYAGGRGDLSEIYNGILIDRSIRAPTGYPLNPIPNAEFVD